MVACRTRNLDFIVQRIERWKSSCSVRCRLWRKLPEICMVREVFNSVLCVIGGVIRFQRHAIITHSFGTVFAKLRIPLTRNLPILGSPVYIDRVFLY
jgi:hypothetical protein